MPKVTASHARFTEVDDFKWFTKTMSRVIGEECGEMYVSYIEDTHYFVDFLRYSIQRDASRTTLFYPLPHPLLVSLIVHAFFSCVFFGINNLCFCINS